MLITTRGLEGISQRSPGPILPIDMPETMSMFQYGDIVVLFATSHRIRDYARREIMTSKSVANTLSG